MGAMGPGQVFCDGVRGDNARESAGVGKKIIDVAKRHRGLGLNSSGLSALPRQTIAERADQRRGDDGGQASGQTFAVVQINAGRWSAGPAREEGSRDGSIRMARWFGCPRSAP